MTIENMGLMEITTAIGCSSFCERYCAQEVFLKRYKNPIKMLTPESFEVILKNIPKTLQLVFGGFGEPFDNPNLLKLVELAHAHENPVGMFTTLRGATLNQAKELCRYKFKVFLIHLPDGINLKLNITEEYMKVFFYVTDIRHIPNATIMQMNANFTSARREDFLRGKPVNKHNYKGTCVRNHEKTMLPDGTVYQCCMDMNLDYPKGNLLKQCYEDIIKKQIRMPVCQYCQWDVPKTRFLIHKTLNLLRTY